MIKVGIIGATGYAGNELVRILVNHPEVEIKWLGSKSYDGEKYSDIYRNTFEIMLALYYYIWKYIRGNCICWNWYSFNSL